MQMTVRPATRRALLETWSVYDATVRVAIVVRHPYQVLQTSEAALDHDRVCALIDKALGRRAASKGAWNDYRATNCSVAAGVGVVVLPCGRVVDS